jgi:hypothetical protein
MDRWLGYVTPSRILRLVRGGLIVAAAYFAYSGWLALDESPSTLDVALPWYAFTIGCLVLAVVTWDSVRLPSRGRVGTFLSGYRWEMVAVAVVLGVAVWVRVHQFGYFPPNNGLAFEEAQTGGLGYAVLNYGLRPIEFALTNYTAALGFLLFGYGALGLRLPFLVFGIAGVFVFYPLLRHLVSAPAALFATGLLAVSRWHAFTSGIADETFLGSDVAILAVFLLFSYLRSGNGLILIALGLVTGALNYEYVAYRHVPYLIVGMLIAISAMRFAREPGVRARPRALVSAAVRGWRSAAAFVIALFVAVSPLVIASIHGDGTYLEPFRRHRAETLHTVFFGLLPSDWGPKLKWTIELFLPFGPKEFGIPLPLDLHGERLFDPVTASLALIAIAWCLLTMFRPYRSFLMFWLLPGLFIGGVIPIHFLVPKFTGLLPAMFAVIALLIDDVWSFCARRQPKLAFAAGAPQLVLASLLVGLLAWAGWTNIDAFYRQAHAQEPRAAFANQLYGLCAVADDVAPDAYVDLWSENGATQGLFGRSDYDWVCHRFSGRPLNFPAEAWPAAVPSEGELAFVYVDLAQPDANGSATRADPAAVVRQGYPGLKHVEDRVLFDTFVVHAFAVSTGDVRKQQGLYADYAGDTSSPPSQIEPAGLFVDGGIPSWPEGANEVVWSGLVLARGGGDLGLSFAEPFAGTIEIDGQVSYQSDGSDVFTDARPFMPGWHSLRLSATRVAGARMPRLEWVEPDGRRGSLGSDDLFAISLKNAWTHTIEATVGDQKFGWQRVDPSPSVGSTDIFLPPWLAQSGGIPPNTRFDLASESWRATWQVPRDGRYALRLTVRAGVATVTVDGIVVDRVETSPDAQVIKTIEVETNAGAHAVEIAFQPKSGQLMGVAFDSEPVGTFEPR